METYHGYVRTPADAIKLFEACRLGMLPRVQRRLSEKERQSIRSGSVFVWDEREAGMRRWTDGKSWSASRVSGSFLTYREMEGERGGGFGSSRRGAGKTPDSGRGSDEDHDDGEPEGYRYKADGLMKQSFSIVTSCGQHLHLISYYSRPQPGQPELAQPSSDPSLRAIVPPKGMYPESGTGETSQTPALTRAPMQQPYMMAPQHHVHAHAHAHGHHHHHHPQAYAYAQHAYGWPPTPAGTPPYGHYAPSPYPPHVHALPPQPSQPYAATSHYTHAPLPPPHSSCKPSLPGHVAAHGPTPRRLHDSPRQKDLQAAAQAVMGEPHLAKGPQGPLPALSPGTSTPPTRHLSASPPRTSHADGAVSRGGARPSLSALLHPTPSSSEPGSAKTGSSPRANGLALDKAGVSEDARALRMLDRKFCI